VQREPRVLALCVGVRVLGEHAQRLDERVGDAERRRTDLERRREQQRRTLGVRQRREVERAARAHTRGDGRVHAAAHRQHAAVHEHVVERAHERAFEVVDVHEVARRGGGAGDGNEERRLVLVGRRRTSTQAPRERDERPALVAVDVRARERARRVRALVGEALGAELARGVVVGGVEVRARHLDEIECAVPVLDAARMQAQKAVPMRRHDLDAHRSTARVGRRPACTGATTSRS
jgi:hypothetical protein